MLRIFVAALALLALVCPIYAQPAFDLGASSADQVSLTPPSGMTATDVQAFADELRPDTVTEETLAAWQARRVLAGASDLELPTLYVSDDAGGDLVAGNDSNPGTRAEPLATPYAAAEVCRAIGRCEVVFDADDTWEAPDLDDGTTGRQDVGVGFQLDLSGFTYDASGDDLAVWVRSTRPGDRFTFDCTGAANALDVTDVWGTTGALFELGAQGDTSGNPHWMVVQDFATNGCNADDADKAAGDPADEFFDTIRGSGNGRILLVNVDIDGGGHLDQTVVSHDDSVVIAMNSRLVTADDGNAGTSGSTMRASGSTGTTGSVIAINSYLEYQDNDGNSTEGLMVVQGDSSAWAIHSYLKESGTSTGQSFLFVADSGSAGDAGHIVSLGSVGEHVTTSNNPSGIRLSSGVSVAWRLYFGLTSFVGAKAGLDLNDANDHDIEFDAACSLWASTGGPIFDLHDGLTADFARMDIRESGFDSDVGTLLRVNGNSYSTLAAAQAGDGSAWASGDGSCFFCDSGSIDIGGVGTAESPFIGGSGDGGTDLSHVYAVPSDEDGDGATTPYRNCTTVFESGVGRIPAFPVAIPAWWDGNRYTRVKLNARQDRSYGAR